MDKINIGYLNKFMIGVVIMAGIIAGSCRQSPSTHKLDTITVSILPQKYFVRAIAGNRFNVNVMVPPGGSPADYEPSPRQVQSLENSVIYFRIGYLAFEEAWMDKFKTVNPEMKIYNTSEGIIPITSDHGHGDHRHSGVDPHIWVSPANVGIIATNMCQALCKNFPSDSSLFAQNLHKFLHDADSINRYMQEKLGPLHGSYFMIYHPALGYLARDYGLIQIPLEFEGKTPPPAYMQEVTRMAREKHLHAILIQSQFNMDNAKTIAHEIQGEVLVIDPLAEDWEHQMGMITSSILKAAGK